MSLQYIRDAYKVPAHKGKRIRDYKGRTGTITGASGAHIKVRLDGGSLSFPFHPTWEMEYLDDAAPAAQSGQRDDQSCRTKIAPAKVEVLE